MKDKNGCPLADRLNVIYIDLLTIRRLVDTPVEKLTPLQKWGMYFSYADDESKSDYIGQIGKTERGIMEATTIIKTMSEDDAAFFREFSRDKAIRDYNAGLSAAKRKGMEDGYAQGLKLGERQGIQKGVQQGIQQGREEGERQGLEQGLVQGREQGAQQKAIEDAVMIVNEFKADPKVAAQKTGAPLDKVLETLAAQPAPAQA